MAGVIKLFFVRGNEIELFRTVVQLENDIERSAVRGKTAGAFRGCGTFQWTSAVRAFCIVSLRYRLSGAGNGVSPILEGGKGSAAASLDYANSKKPAWLGEMLGYSANGLPRSSRLLRISNSNQKRPGPVCLAMNPQVISPDQISVFLDDKPIVELHMLREILFNLERGCPKEGGTAIEGEARKLAA